MAWLWERQMKIGLALAMAVVCVLGMVSYRSSQQFVENAAWVDHTQEVLRQLAAVYVPVQRVQIATRDFALTGDPKYLAPIDADIRNTNEQIRTLKRLTADNPRQQARLDLLQERLDRRFGVALEFIAKVRAGTTRGEAAAEFTAKAASLDKVQPLVEEMQDEELALLSERSQREQASARNTIALSAVLTVMIGALICLAYWAVTRDLLHRKRAQVELAQLNRNLEVANQELMLRNQQTAHANQMKSKFLASMSHELRTPLNAILGFSDLLEGETPGPVNEKQKRFLGHIRTGA